MATTTCDTVNDAKKLVQMYRNRHLLRNEFLDRSNSICDKW